MSRPRSVVAVALATGLVLTGGMASAAQKSVKDEHHDVDVAASDIQRVTVKNAGAKLSIRVKMARASAGRTHLVATLTPVVPVVEGEEPAAASGVYTVRSVAAEGKAKSKKIGATLEYQAAGAEPVLVHCDGLKATISAGKRGNSRFRIPQVCFGDDAGTMLVDVMSANVDGDVVDEVAKPLKVKKAKKAKKQA